MSTPLKLRTGDEGRLDAVALTVGVMDGVAGVRASGAKSLEALLVDAVQLSRTNATVLRVLPALFARAADAVDFDTLVAVAESRGLERHLGMLLELGARRERQEALRDVAARLKPPHCAVLEPYLDQDRSTYGRKLAELRTPPLAREWGFLMNMPEDAFLPAAKLGGPALQ